MPGNWADPTILKDGPDYYMTHSSFQRQPGLLIWHSRDLRRWKPVGHAVLNQKGAIWAPDLIKHQGRYYIYYPVVQGGKFANWVVIAECPTGPWSAPQTIGEGNIMEGVGDDPSHSRPLCVAPLHTSYGIETEVEAEGNAAAGWCKPRCSFRGRGEDASATSAASRCEVSRTEETAG